MTWTFSPPVFGLIYLLEIVSEYEMVLGLDLPVDYWGEDVLLSINQRSVGHNLYYLYRLKLHTNAFSILYRLEGCVENGKLLHLSSLLLSLVVEYHLLLPLFLLLFSYFDLLYFLTKSLVH